MRKSGKPDLRAPSRRMATDTAFAAMLRDACLRQAPQHEDRKATQERSKLPVGDRRQILLGEDVLGLRPVLEVIGQRNLVDRFRQTRHVDIAVAVRLHPGRDEVVAQRHLEAV